MPSDPSGASYLAMPVPILTALIAGFCVIVAAIIALFGALVTNQGEMTRLQTKLQHDAEASRQQHDHDMRQRVYLDAADAVAGMMEQLAQYANLAVPAGSGAMQFAGALTKLGLIATPETLRPMLEAQRVYLEAALSLTIQRMRLTTAQNGLTAIAQALTTTATPGEVEKLRAAHGKLQEEYWQQFWMVATLTIEKIIAYGEAALPAAVAIRRELAVPFDEAEFNALIQGSLRTARETAQGWVTILRQQAGLG